MNYCPKNIYSLFPKNYDIPAIVKYPKLINCATQSVVSAENQNQPVLNTAGVKVAAVTSRDNNKKLLWFIDLYNYILLICLYTYH